MDAEIVYNGGDSPASRVIVAIEDQKSIKNLQRSQKYKVFQKMKKELHEIFDRRGFQDTDDCLEYLAYVVKDLTCESTSVKKDIIDNQLQSLSLPDRNSLITLLTHQSNSSSDDEAPRLNESMLAIHPSLRKRSGELLEQKQRKIRSDKIDLQFISDFMHNYCR
jgi:hypothetical protein